MQKAPSTNVENALPQGEHGNIHHNVPESRTGSNSEINLSSVLIGRHNDFHQTWGSNALPTELIRYVALHSIGLQKNKHRLDATQVRKLFEATRSQAWEQYYSNDAVVSAAGVHATLRSMQSIRSTANFLMQEKIWTNNTIAAIRGEEVSFPVDKHVLLDHSMEFFDVHTPSRVLESFLTEKNNGELSWCKPLRHHVRENVLNILKRREATPTHGRKEYIHILLDHHKALDQHSREIERTLTRVESEIRKMMHMSVLRPDDGK